MGDGYYRVVFPVLQVLAGWQGGSREAAGKAVVEGRGAALVSVTLRGARPGRYEVAAIDAGGAGRIVGELMTDDGGFGACKLETALPPETIRAVAVCRGANVPYIGHSGEMPDWRPQPVRQPPRPDNPPKPGNPPAPLSSPLSDWFTAYLRAFNAALPPPLPPPEPDPLLDPVFARGARMNPFRLRGAAEWARVTPAELKRLGEPYARLAASAIAQESWRGFKHLVLGRDRAAGKVMLALPNLYRAAAAAEAQAAGFAAFRPASGDAPREGVYGYWVWESPGSSESN